MKISIRLLCVDIPPEKSGEVVIELREGAAVEQALEKCVSENELGVPPEDLKQSAFLINKTSASLDSVLSDGDVLTVMRTLAGG